MLNAVAAPDPRDPTTLGQPLEDFPLASRPGSIEGMRVAMPDTKELPNFMHPDVTKAWQAAGRAFESLGAPVEAGWLTHRDFHPSRPPLTINPPDAPSPLPTHIPNPHHPTPPTLPLPPPPPNIL